MDIMKKLRLDEMSNDINTLLCGVVYDPFAAKNQEFVKAEKPENCKADYHNYGVRKYGFCANCNGVDLHNAT